MSSIANRRCLVLGASGFIGRWVVEELLAKGVPVGLQVRDPERLSEQVRVSAEEIYSTDLTKPGSGIEVVRLFHPDVVFNLSGYGVAKDERDEAVLQRINAGLVSELARALIENKPTERCVRLIQAGSALEYGARAESMDEAAPVNPTTPYGRAKLAATVMLDEARNAGLPCLTARLFTVFGQGERPGRLVSTLIGTRFGSERIGLSGGNQSRDWTYVEDVARALVGLAEVSPDAVLERRYPFDAPAINVASGALTTVRNFVSGLAVELSINPDRLGFGDLKELPEEMHHPPVPKERLEAALGWAPPATPKLGMAQLRRRLDEEADAQA